MSDLVQPVTTEDHAQGPSDAPITLVEYGDYQCPHCGLAYSRIRHLQKQFGHKMRFVFRNFPLKNAHPYAEFAARVRKDFMGGVRSGVNGTPGIFINGRLYEGDLDMNSVLRVVE